MDNLGFPAMCLLQKLLGLFQVVTLHLREEQPFQHLKGVHLRKWLIDKAIKMSQPRIKNLLATCR